MGEAADETMEYKRTVHGRTLFTSFTSIIIKIFIT
jgi:hypothetical protein